MTADISLSNGQYEIDVNSNGNLIIKDSTDTIILKHEDGGSFSLGADLQLGDLVDGSTGDTVYDGSTETIGNGTQTVDANSVNTEYASYTGTTPHTIYVRPGGSDENNGLTEANAVASVDEAFQKLSHLPIQNRNGFSHRIDLGDGNTFTESGLVSAVAPHASKVSLTSSGSTCTVELPSGTSLAAFRTRLFINGVDITAADLSNPPDRCVESLHQSRVNIEDSTLGPATDRVAIADFNSYLSTSSSVVVDGNSENCIGVEAHSASAANLNGTVRNCDIGLIADRVAGMAVRADVDNCSTAGVRTADNAAFKQTGGSVTNCGIAYEVRERSYCEKRIPDSSLSGNTTFTEVSGAGTFYDESTGKDTTHATNQVMQTLDMDSGNRFVSTGDFVGLGKQVAYSRTRSTTSTSYQRDRDHFLWKPVWNEITPDGADPAVLIRYQLRPGTDETMDARLYNGKDGETIQEVTGVSSLDDFSALVPYTPSTTDSAVFIDFEMKTSNGANASEVYDLQVIHGVQL